MTLKPAEWHYADNMDDLPDNTIDARRRSGLLSLRAKGILAIVIMAGYAVLVGISTSSDRESLLRMVDTLEQVHRAEAQLLETNTSMARTLLAVNVAFSAEDLAAATLRAMIEIDATLSLVEALHSTYPTTIMPSSKLHALVRELAQAPDLGSLAVTREALNDLTVELDKITRLTHEHRLSLLDAYRKNYDRITLSGLAMVVFGLIVLGAATAIFFSRLTWDIRKLETHALDVVKGYRGNPLSVTRSDEIGSLMHAVNQMQTDLRERERQIERARQEQFHREKMAAVGSLAAQLAHEINNPIAAITGVASTMSVVQQSKCCPNNGQACQPSLILEQAKRISTITRQIADFTRPQALHRELLNVNELIRNTCNFVSYDRRFRHIALTTDLDGELPALHAVSDHLTQVLMNLLINAADALEDIPAEQIAAITVTSRCDGDTVLVEVKDNGHGMDASTLEHAFDEYFSTKPADRGTGLGLALSRELIAEAGGIITLESRLGKGTTARITLPMHEAEAV